MSKITIVICILYIVICRPAVAEEGLFTYNHHGKRDPFVPLVGVTARAFESLEDIMSIEDVNLQGIAVDSSGKKVAILNGEMVKEGETVGHLTVKKISKDTITIMIDEEESTLNIYVEEYH